MAAPVNLSNNTSAGATGTANGMFNDSGFVVNFGSGSASAAVAPAAAIPGYLYAAIAVAAVLWLTRKH